LTDCVAGELRFERVALRGTEQTVAQFGASFLDNADRHELLSVRRGRRPRLAVELSWEAQSLFGRDQISWRPSSTIGQDGVNRSRKAGIVQLDGEIVALGVLGGLLPGRAHRDMVVRPEAIDLPRMEGGRQRPSCLASSGAQHQRKKVEDGRCGDKIEGARSRSILWSDQP
jgi:hypothetical protein